MTSGLAAGEPTRCARRERLGHFCQDTDFTVVRDAAALAKLPEAEQHAWRQLWDDFTALKKTLNQSR
jgi:hypothetical protein